MVTIELGEIWVGDDYISRILLFYTRRFPNHRGKWRIFRFLASRLRPFGIALKDYRGARLRVDACDYIGQVICFNGAFEPLSLQLASKLMEKGGTFLDVGSNFGLYTCSLAPISGVNCIAVEASAIAFARLFANINRNAFDNVIAVNTAVGASNGIVNLVTPNPLNLGTTRVSDSPSSIGSFTHFVPMLPLSEVLNKCAASSSIQLMKIDVEGYELEVFLGFDFSSANRPKNIIMEYSSSAAVDEARLAGCYELLISKGYRPYTINGEQFTKGMEILEENLWWVDQRV